MGTISLDKTPHLGISLDPGLLRLLPIYPHAPRPPFRLKINPPPNEWEGGCGLQIFCQLD